MRRRTSALRHCVPKSPPCSALPRKSVPPASALYSPIPAESPPARSPSSSLPLLCSRRNPHPLLLPPLQLPNPNPPLSAAFDPSILRLTDDPPAAPASPLHSYLLPPLAAAPGRPTHIRPWLANSRDGAPIHHSWCWTFSLSPLLLLPLQLFC